MPQSEDSSHEVLVLQQMITVNHNAYISSTLQIGHFTVMDGSEAEGDLVLIQTFFALLWKLFLKNTS